MFVYLLVFFPRREKIWVIVVVSLAACFWWKTAMDTFLVASITVLE